MMYRNKIALLLFLIVWMVGFPGSLTSQNDSDYTRIRIDYESRSDWFGVHDIDRDGLRDILIQKGNHLVAYLQLDNHTFDILRPENRRIATIPDSVFLFDFLDNSNQKSEDPAGISVLGATPDGYLQIPFQEPGSKNGNDSSAIKKKQILKTNTVFEGKSSDPPSKVNLTPDINMDGRTDLLVPVVNGYRVYIRNQNGSYEKNIHFSFTPFGNGQVFSNLLNFKIKTKISFPKYYVGSFLSEGRQEFALFIQDRLLVYSIPNFENDSKKQYSPRPTVIPVKKMEKREDEFFSYLLPPDFVDLSNNDIADLVVTVPGDGVLYIYHGGNGKNSFKKPKQILKYGGWIVRKHFQDLTGDGKKDLVLLRMDEVGVWDALDILSSYQVDLYLEVVRNKGDGTFEKQAAFSRDITARINIGSANMRLRAETPFFFRTPDRMVKKDELADLLIKSKSDQIDIFAGNRETIFKSSPARSVPMIDTGGFSSTTAICRDITGNQQSDLILKSRNFNRDRNLLQIFLFDGND